MCVSTLKNRSDSQNEQSSDMLRATAGSVSFPDFVSDMNAYLNICAPGRHQDKAVAPLKPVDISTDLTV